MEIENDNITLSADQQCALNAAMAGFDIFITGEGGTGKSFILKTIIDYLKSQNKNVLVCAPTGISAAEINGATIHRTFGFPSTVAINSVTNTLKVHTPETVCIADVIVIDEVSMVRADFFDSIIESIREAEKPENGGRRKQIILCGDVFQLAPFVATEDEWLVLDKFYSGRIDPPWFFIGCRWKTCDFKIIRLKQIFRQKDPVFTANLNLLRKGDASCLDYFNKNCVNKPDPQAVYLLPTNEEVRKMNSRCLNSLKGSFFEIPTIISDSLLGDKKEMNWIKKLPGSVLLKEGCRIMLTANDTNSDQRSINVVDYLTDVPWWKKRKNMYVNGSTGVIESAKIFPERHRNDSVFVRLDDDPDELIEIYRYEYPVNRYVAENGVLKLERIGSYSLIPIVPAYAFTIHKAQGKTFKRVNVDPRCRSNGQLYVALSRAVSVDNLHLLYPLKKEFLKTDLSVLEWIEKIPDDTSLFSPDKRGPKPKPKQRELGEPAVPEKKQRGRKGTYGGKTKALRMPEEIADGISAILAEAFPQDGSDPDKKRYKKLLTLLRLSSK